MRQKKKSVICVRKKLFFAGLALTIACVAFSLTYATTRVVQVGELKARVTLLETILRQPVTEADLRQFEARVKALAEPPAGLAQFLELLASAEARLPFPLVFDSSQLRLVARNSAVAGVGRISNIRHTNEHLFWSIGDIRCVFFNAPDKAKQALTEGEWVAVIGRSGEWQGTPQIVVSATSDIIPAR